ncbi:MAG: MgtC/SapB family protein [Desulfuromonas sp.]|nr:MgtC/SapB family protein [Desulfuromonas sp.]
MITVESSILHLFESYSLALLLGALMGLERERSDTRIAGLRTFILVTLFGSICGNLALAIDSSWLIIAGLATIATQGVMVHVVRMKEQISSGMTTAIALLVAYLVGVLLSQGQRITPITLCLATTMVLCFKPQMHAFSHRLEKRDLYAIFQFILVAFIILPVVPNQGYGPYLALNPYNIWLMVVLISGINLVGYIILKLVDHRWGSPMIGILGGIVSSTATTLTFSRQSSAVANISHTAAVVVSLASTMVLIRITAFISLINPQLMEYLWLPMSGMFIGGLLPIVFIWRKARSENAPRLESKNPAELSQALIFGLLYGGVLLAVSVAKDFFGNEGVYLVSLISGFTDVDAITLTNARLSLIGELGSVQAATSVLIAVLANLVFKLGMVAVLGTRQMFRGTLFCFSCLALPALLIFV